MGKIGKDFNPDECRRTAHIGYTGRAHTPRVFCKGIRGALTPEQIREYAPQFAHVVAGYGTRRRRY